MSLYVPPFSWGKCTDTQTGTPDATANGGVGVQQTSANTDGTPVTVLSALGHDGQFIVLQCSGITGSTTDNATLLDILIDPAGGTSWASLIEDLNIGYMPLASAASGYTGVFQFPLFIPAGASLGAQVRRATTASNSIRLFAWVFGEPSRPDAWWCGSKVETLGSVAASSRGTIVTPGNAAWGSWTNIGSTISGRYGAIQFACGGSDSNATTRGGYWQVGANSARINGLPTIYTAMSSTESMTRGGPCMPMFCDIAAGTQLQARGYLSGSVEDYNVTIHGVY